MTPKLKFRNDGNIQNESCSTTWVDPITFFEPFPNPENSPLEPKKSKMTPKLSENQMSGLKKTKKMKVFQLHEWTQKQFCNTTPTPKIIWAPKSPKWPQNQVNIENESCSTTWGDPKSVYEPYANPKNSPLGPQKLKMTPKLSQNQMSEFEET